MPYTKEQHLRRRASSAPEHRLVVPDTRWVFAKSPRDKENWATWVAEAKAPLTLWIASTLSRQQYFKEMEERARDPMEAFVVSAQVKRAGMNAKHRRSSLQMESRAKQEYAEQQIKARMLEAERKAQEILNRAEALHKHGPRAQNMMRFKAVMLKQQAEYECQLIRNASDFESKKLIVQAARSMDQVATEAEKAWRTTKNRTQAGVVKATVKRVLGEYRGSVIIDEIEQKC